MSRNQSPIREQSLTINIVADKLLELSDTIKEMKIQLSELKTGEQTRNSIIERPIVEHVGKPIDNYNKAMPLIPEFDGNNVETFINHIQAAVKRLTADQHDLLLCAIIAQKLTGRAKNSVRMDTTPNFPQFYEKLRYLYGKALNLSALEVQRDTCIQRQNESVDDFINRFLRIHDDIIHAVNSQGIGTVKICVQEQLYQEKAVEVFRRNVKPEIGDHLYSFEFNLLNEAFSKARAFEGELQLRKIRMQRHEAQKKQFQPKGPTRFQFKECTYCKRRGHEEKECRTKAFHQQRQQGQQNFRERQSPNRPPDRASHLLHATDLDPDQYNLERSTRDLEGHTAELPELH